MIEPLPLLPATALGPFHLGSTLFNVLNLLRSSTSLYPTVNISWDELAPSEQVILVELIVPPLSLTFASRTQRLVKIQIKDPVGEWVRYKGKTLGGEEEGGGEGVVKRVRRVMGPTFGEERGDGTEREEQFMCYPGVVFGIVGGKLHRIVVSPLPEQGVDLDKAWLNPTLVDSPLIAHGDLKLVEIKLDSERKPASVVLHFHGLAKSVDLFIGETSSEDLVCELGSAVRSFWKEDDRLAIHSTSSTDSSLLPNPYFLAYPHLGLTFLLDPTSHTLLKTILHSNTPGEISFGRSSRCSFLFITADGGTKVAGESGFGAIRSILTGVVGPRSIPGTTEKKGDSPTMGRVGSMEDGRSDSPSPASSRSRKSKNGGNRVVEAVKVIDDLSPPVQVKVKGDGGERPMILDRTVDGGDAEVVGKTTEIHGFPGVALEVTGTGDVETVWLF